MRITLVLYLVYVLCCGISNSKVYITHGPHWRWQDGAFTSFCSHEWNSMWEVNWVMLEKRKKEQKSRNTLRINDSIQYCIDEVHAASTISSGESITISRDTRNITLHATCECTKNSWFRHNCANSCMHSISWLNWQIYISSNNNHRRRFRII